MYIGGRVHTQLAAIAGLGAFIDHVHKEGAGKTLVMQYCGDGIPGGTKVGIVSSTSGGVEALAEVQEAVRSWDEGECVTGIDEVGSVEDMMLWTQPPKVGNRFAVEKPLGRPSTNATSRSNSTHTPLLSRSSSARIRLAERADTPCEETVVEQDDDCYVLRDRCGLTDIDDFYSYNKGIECNLLMLGQRICCSPGGLESRRKKPDADGTCATYQVASRDTCGKIAADFDLTVDELEEFNDGTTWGWTGCKLLPDTLICISEGDPPMPLPDPDAKCGPRAAQGERDVPKGTKLEDLNPCPLNACCSKWGFCGTTEEFCKVDNKKGNPGTRGCISNCGTSVVNNDEPPEEFIRIAYFEGWNQDRNCLRMDVREVPKLEQYTHIHFAFPRLTETFDVDVSFIQSQFDAFKSLKGIKRIASFGGWADSTAPDRYKILREAVLEENRDKAVDSLVEFVTSNGLDGLDMDWEYPAAPDIPDIDPADPEEGQTYLEFLKLLRKRLPASASLSIASASGQWYLQGFPIAEIAKIVDYIVYMTYDLHGQWDYDSKFSVEGCPTGDCLRSHVNMTETYMSLAMITKAGVPANKVIVGVTSYGRSFRMVEPGCDGPMCRFVGPESGARAGLCTGEPGYIADAEIEKIIADPSRNAKTRLDSKSMSNILVYDDVEWVAYMDAANKKSRSMSFEYLNFGGTTDWAVDLQAFSANEFMTDDTYAIMMEEGGRCPWRNTEGYHCDQEASVNTTLPGNVRWRDRACDCAWMDFTDEWRRVLGQDSKASFSDTAAAFFKAGEGLWECADVDRGCFIRNMQCQDSQVSNKTGPAGALIMTSFAQVSSKMNEIYRAIEKAEVETRGEILEFHDTFVEVVVDDSERNFMLSVDILGMFFSAFSAPFFNNLMKGKRGVSNTQDLTYNMAGWGGSYIKDAEEFTTPGGVDILALSGNLSSITESWRVAFARINKDLFSGKGEGYEYFWELIKDGKHVKQGRSSDELESDWHDSETRRRWAERMIYAMMIPTAWYAGGRSAVVLDTGKDCDDAGYLNGEKMSSKTEETARVCHNKRLYYLVAPAFGWDTEYIPPSNCVPNGGGNAYICWTPGREPENFFTLLPGSKDLKESNNRWGGITVKDIVIGSLNTYEANGKKNGADALDIKDKEEFMKLYDNSEEPINLRAPGLLRVPVCSPDEAYSVWEDSKDGKSNEDADYEDKRYWPCKKP